MHLLVNEFLWEGIFKTECFEETEKVPRKNEINVQTWCRGMSSSVVWRLDWRGWPVPPDPPTTVPWVESPVLTVEDVVLRPLAARSGRVVSSLLLSCRRGTITSSTTATLVVYFVEGILTNTFLF